MLTLHTGSTRDCSGLLRRDFVRAGALAIGGLALPQLLAAKEAARSSGKSYVRDRSIVLLFLGGGASHIETFNPNLDAPAPYCSITGEVKTSIPGLTLGGTFPQLAVHADRLAVVRSFSHDNGNHPKAIIHVLSGGTDPTGDGKTGQSMGSAYARIRGANHEASGLPTYCLLTSDEIDGQYRTERGRIEAGSRPGQLGLAYAPFDPSGGSQLLKNLSLNLPVNRLDDRKSLLSKLDNAKREIDASGNVAGADRFEQQALDMIVRGAGEAFDTKREDKRLIERYDTSSFRVGKKVFQPSALGRQMLLARRLVEAGSGFVTVQNSGWDMHADGNNPGVAAGMEMLGRPLDKAVSAFLEDLDARGLADKVLLVITGDFGRTPTINQRGGRDHYPKLCTLAFAGGGLARGQIIGQAGRKNDAPASDPIRPENLASTVLHALFDVGQLRLDPGVPRDLARLAEAPPIAELAH
ncbi:MAG TPA: DUF1501 domain-containing protein [Pirellulaceae bacterium]|nr:DUF1501 domain-containing protein [Pirellulaceae bacterium]